MSTPLPVVYSGVDWFTVTTGDTDKSHAAWHDAGELAKRLEADGNALQEWRGNGYSGLACSHFRYGIRDGDTLVELQGHLADPHWRKYFPYARNVPRIDVAVDVTFSRPVENVARDAYEAERFGEKNRGQRISRTFMVSTGGGQTCYLGSPKSEKRGRLYDKGIQSGGCVPGETWRYEVQVRNDMGRDLASHLYSVSDMRKSITAYVHRYFSSRGITPWFRADSSPMPIQHGQPKSDFQRFEYWLASQVAPGIDRYSKLGYRDAIIRALGLKEDK